MTPGLKKLLPALLALGITTPALSSSDVPPPVAARISLMQLYSFNLSLMGGMMQGKIEYDADAATRAAAAILALTAVDQSRMWPEGTDNFEIDPGTRALPELWEDLSDLVERNVLLKQNAATLAATAGDGMEAMRKAFVPLIDTCGACHKRYRASKE
jgi:cytochrome c556